LEPISITCKDNYVLEANLYSPKAEAKSAIMVCPATGIKKEFYHALSNFLAENGHGVIAFDNRGIGASKKLPIKKEPANLVDWGQLDMTAVLEELKRRFPEIHYHVLGHSAGGQLVGLMENALDVKSIFNFACSSGQIKHLSYPNRPLGMFFMDVFIPISNRFFGHTKSQWVGMGEPLPKNVAAQWAKWCNGAGYVATDFGKSIQKHFYDELKIPSKWLYATDDYIANLTNVKDMIRVYSKTEYEIVELDPKKLGYKEIGHMKFFSSKKKALWPQVTEWLDLHNS